MLTSEQNHGQPTHVTTVGVVGAQGYRWVEHPADPQGEHTRVGSGVHLHSVADDTSILQENQGRTQSGPCSVTDCNMCRGDRLVLSPMSLAQCEATVPAFLGLLWASRVTNVKACFSACSNSEASQPVARV